MVRNDPVTVIKNLLDNNWDSDNTDSITPTILYSQDAKRLSFNPESATSIIVVNHISSGQEYNASGSSSKRVTEFLSVDIRSMVSKSHTRKVLDEVTRIFEANILLPDSDYDELFADGDVQVISRGLKGVWRFVKDVELRDSNTARGGL